MLTKAFKSGNSLAVRIPKNMRLGDENTPLDIERVAEGILIRPVLGRSLAGLERKFAGFPTSFMPNGREMNEDQERNW